jgi:flagellar hook-length control protein FliK
MPDSIFDLKQTLFTSNLPVPVPRDRGADKVYDFDQALHSAQRQTHDENCANNGPEAPTANEKRIEDTEPTADSSHEEHDEVTLSKHASETPHAKPTETTKSKKPKLDDAKTGGAKEPTAEEIAASGLVPQAPLQPVVQRLPEEAAEQGDLPQGPELNDAVQLGSKRVHTNSAESKVPTAAAAPPIVPVADEQAVVPLEEAAVDANAVVVAAELHSTKVANEKKSDTKASNKPSTEKASSSDSKRTNTQSETAAAGKHSEEAIAITDTSEAESETPAPKRRLEPSRQALPEVHERTQQVAALPTVPPEATAAATTSDPATEPDVSAAKTPELPAITSKPAETVQPPNQHRGSPIPGSFASRLEAAATERKNNEGLSGVDRARFVQRVAKAFQRVGETEGEIRLRLSPPELGAVKLEVSLRDGAMFARMETETTTARNLLMDNLPQLKERLAEQNVRIETFEVEVRDQANHSNADDAQEQLRQQNEQQRNRLRGERATSPVVAAPIVQTLSAARQTSQLNIII